MAAVWKIRDLPSGRMARAVVDGDEICIANVEGKVFAVAHRCTHAGASLSNGRLDGKVITCPAHGSKFDVSTGKCLSGPFGGPPVKDLKTYKASVKGEDIIVEK